MKIQFFKSKKQFHMLISFGIYFVQALKVKPILCIIRLEFYFKNKLEQLNGISLEAKGRFL